MLRADDVKQQPVKRTSDEVLLVYNANSPISKSVADDYAAKRKIKNVVIVRCADSALKTADETISLAEYSQAIEKPVRDYLSTHPAIAFIVLTKGVPIRIHGAETGERPDKSPADTPLNASVDSHLASMDYKDLHDAVKMSITGSGATGSGWANRYWNANEPFSHQKFGGYLVTRLDGYTEADAKALVTRALAAEQKLGDGKVLLDVQPAFGLGNKADAPAKIKGTVIPDESRYSDWNADMIAAHDILKSRGVSDELDLSQKFIGQRKDLLGYFSWGSNDAKFSNRAYQSLAFAPGSISDTAVSTSARTFLPTHGGQSLLVDLIAHGLTCGKGYVDEPLLQAIASPSVTMDRYTAGYTMAESFYAASHFTGWQDVVVGDPLCCPYWGKVGR
ncbi:MAG TPA: TIGR03790 family protein [Tepidisphaeraceae bacterium]|jgi:uncharacterized protein (TIGR03790 family)|nr:TIGR03790 family protein [Tepidisphaeraceae bacterium]